MNLPLPAKKPRAPLRYHLGLLLTTTIWASTFINIKIVLPQVPPNTLAFLRFSVASIALGLYLKSKHQPPIKKQDLPRIGLSGLTGITFYNFLQNQGLRFAGATDAAILASMAPVFIALFAVLFLKEKLFLHQVVGIILAFIGSVLVATKGSVSNLVLNPLRLFGDFLVLLTGLSWAIYSINLKTLLNCYPPTTVLAYSTFTGTIFLLPLALMEYPVNFGAINLSGWLNILYLGLAASALAYLIWNAALTRVSAVTAGSYLYLIPVIASFIAALFLQEVPGLYALIGGGIVLIGTYFASK